MGIFFLSLAMPLLMFEEERRKIMVPLKSPVSTERYVMLSDGRGGKL